MIWWPSLLPTVVCLAGSPVWWPSLSPSPLFGGPVCPCAYLKVQGSCICLCRISLWIWIKTINQPANHNHFFCLSQACGFTVLLGFIEANTPNNWHFSQNKQAAFEFPLWDSECVVSKRNYSVVNWPAVCIMLILHMFWENDALRWVCSWALKCFCLMGLGFCCMHNFSHQLPDAKLLICIAGNGHVPVLLFYSVIIKVYLYLMDT